jgi:O-antigen/teichoic acid export membrane protein
MIFRIMRSSLMQTAGIYTATSIINTAIPFLLMPVLTRYMTPSDYGIVSMFGVLVSFISPFTGLSMHGAIQRQYYEREHVDLPIYITNCLLMLLVSSTLTSIIFYVLSGPISKLSSFPESWMWIVIAVSIAGFINSIVLVLWQVQIKPYAFGRYQIAQTIFNIVLSLWLVVGLDMAWKGRIQAQLFTSVIFACIGLVILKKNGWIKFGFNGKYIKNAMYFGGPLIPHSIGGVMMTMTDRLFITNMVGLSATGLYSVGYSFAMIIGFIENSFNQAYVPWLFERLKRNDDNVKIKIVKVTYVYFFLILLIALALSLIAPWFLSFFVGKRFAGAHIFVFWIAMGYAFNGMYKMVVNYIFYVQKTYILAWITFFCALLNIFFNYIFIKMNGAVGAAQATCVTFFIAFIMTFILSSRVYKMPWLFFKK